MLVGIWVIATINVLSRGSISMAKSRFGIEKPVVWCGVGLLGRLEQNHAQAARALKLARPGVRVMVSALALPGV